MAMRVPDARALAIMRGAAERMVTLSDELVTRRGGTQGDPVG